MSLRRCNFIVVTYQRDREELHISSRLKDALIADQLAAVDVATVQRLPTGPRELADWIEELARQTTIQCYGDVADAADIQETLRFVLSELDPLLRPWPPSQQPGIYSAIADAATKGLRPHEFYATLLCGPPEWTRGERLLGGPVTQVHKQFREFVVKGLASTLSTLTGRWVTWDVPHLRKRLDEEIEARMATNAVPKAAPPRPRLQRRTSAPSGWSGQFKPRPGMSSFEQALNQRRGA